MIYEYQCEQCDYSDEIIVKYKDRDNTRHCPRCGKQLFRLPSKPLFDLKGDGFYRKGVQ